MIFKTLSVSLLVIAIDRLTKYLLLSNFREGESISVIPGIFHITLVFNTGAAFGMFKGQSISFIALAVFIITLILFYVWRSKCKDIFLLIALGLILGGAIGNLIDRAVFGYVVDFLDFRIWPVFNIADSSITIGASILALKLILDKKCCTI